MISQRPEKYANTAKEWAELARQRPISLRTLVRQISAASRAKPPVFANGKRILLLRSLADQMVNPECTLRLQKLWNCDRRDHPTAGHDLSLDEPDWLLEQLNAWLMK